MARLLPLLPVLVSLSSPVSAQLINSTTLSFTLPSGYSTASFNASAQPTPFTRTDFSENALNELWNQIGPISTGPVTTTVSPTPEPTAYPQPNGDRFHGLVSSNHPELDNVKLPKGFKWGLSSSAYQIEGAAKDEGKGPSIWDLLAHRVPNHVLDNSTGDVVASHYWLYKQDIARLANLGIPGTYTMQPPNFKVLMIR
jgi:hypothetical protein